MQMMATDKNDTLQIDPRAVIKLPLYVGLTLVLTGGLLAGLLFLANASGWWRGFAAASVASALAALVSLPPLLMGLRRGLNGAMIGYFSAMGLRAMVSLGAALLAIHAGGYPMKPTLLLLVPYYFAMLAVETAYVSKALLSAKSC